MKPGEAIKEKKIRGKKVIFRVPTQNDWKQLWENYNLVITGTEFMGMETPVKPEDTKKWISKTLDSLKEKKLVIVSAEVDGRLVGNCDITKEELEVKKHTGHLGVYVIAGYRNMGIGTELIKIAMEEAKKIGIEVVTLDVVAENKTARDIYKKCGFKIVGEIEKGYKRKSGYQDMIVMMKHL